MDRIGTRRNHLDAVSNPQFVNPRLTRHKATSEGSDRATLAVILLAAGNAANSPIELRPGIDWGLDGLYRGQSPKSFGRRRRDGRLRRQMGVCREAHPLYPAHQHPFRECGAVSS
jgi:hypothetical protein